MSDTKKHARASCSLYRRNRYYTTNTSTIHKCPVRKWILSTHRQTIRLGWDKNHTKKRSGARANHNFWQTPTRTRAAITKKTPPKLSNNPSRSRLSEKHCMYDTIRKKYCKLNMAGVVYKAVKRCHNYAKNATTLNQERHLNYSTFFSRLLTRRLPVSSSTNLTSRLVRIVRQSLSPSSHALMSKKTITYYFFPHVRYKSKLFFIWRFRNGAKLHSQLNSFSFFLYKKPRASHDSTASRCFGPQRHKTKNCNLFCGT